MCVFLHTVGCQGRTCVRLCIGGVIIWIRVVDARVRAKRMFSWLLLDSISAFQASKGITLCLQGHAYSRSMTCSHGLRKETHIKRIEKLRQTDRPGENKKKAEIDLELERDSDRKQNEAFYVTTHEARICQFKMGYLVGSKSPEERF